MLLVFTPYPHSGRHLPRWVRASGPGRTQSAPPKPLNHARAAQREGTHRMRGAYGARIRTQLYLECYCACRRHQGCHCRETETSVRLRFLGSSRTSRCLLISPHGVRGAKRNGWSKIKRGAPSWRSAVRQLAWRQVVGSASSSVEPLGHLDGGGAGPSGGRADVSTADLANWCDCPHMRRGSTNQCNPRRRQGGDPLCSRLP
jgi:hypothetical protein